MPDLLVTDELHAYLLAQGVGIHPNVLKPYEKLETLPADVTRPSVWLHPRDGHPMPRRNKAGRDLEPATVTLIASNLAAPSELGDFIEVAFVDVVVRARQNSTGMFLQRTIRTLLTDANAVGGKKYWMMNSLLVEYSTQWRGDQALAEDSETWTRVQSFQIACRRKALAGLPYVP